jgi:hypothetical protein
LKNKSDPMSNLKLKITVISLLIQNHIIMALKFRVSISKQSEEIT